jgi:hypothetical protein
MAAKVSRNACPTHSLRSDRRPAARIWNWSPDFERLFVPFRIDPGTTIAPGDYWFHRHTFTFETAQNRPLYFKIRSETGSFYSGKSHEASPQLVWSKDRHLTATFELQQNRVKVREGGFRTRLALFKLDYAFNPSLSLSNFAIRTRGTRGRKAARGGPSSPATRSSWWSTTRGDTPPSTASRGWRRC